MPSPKHKHPHPHLSTAAASSSQLHHRISSDSSADSDLHPTPHTSVNSRAFARMPSPKRPTFPRQGRAVSSEPLLDGSSDNGYDDRSRQTAGLGGSRTYEVDEAEVGVGEGLLGGDEPKRMTTRSPDTAKT